jgi:hypothetical protein
MMMFSIFPSKKIKCKTKNPTLFQDKTSNRIKRQIDTPNKPMSDMLLSWLGTVTSIKIGTSFMFYLGQRCSQASVNM